MSSTISLLKNCIPGQSDQWYQRIATEIAAGRMPMPQLPEPEPVLEAIAVAVAPPGFMVVAEAVPLAAVLISPPPPVIVVEPAPELPTIEPLPPQPVAVAEPEPPKPRKQTQFPPLAPASKAQVPLQASQQQLEQAAKSARAKDSQRSKPQGPKTHPPLALITRLGGDHKAADRLFQKLQLLYPGRTDHWIWDKALWDLHRDRM